MRVEGFYTDQGHSINFQEMSQNKIKASLSLLFHLFY